MSNESRIWNYLIAKGLSAHGAAGLMGNLKAESALRPNNLQNTYEKKLGYTDSDYTTAVDNGSYTNFVRDAAGYGLAQWTYWSRKQALLDFARAAGKSIGDLDMQLDFLYKELSESYKAVLATLKTATSVLEASNVVLIQYERPANQGSSVQEARAKYGQAYFDKYAEQAGNDGGKPTMSNSSLVNYTKISPHRNSPRNSPIRKITIHHMAGNLTVETCGEVFQGSREASSNYGIGTDGRVGMYVEEKDRSWCSSSGDNDHQAVTIEVANDGGDPDWHVSDTALAKLIDLCVDICRRNGIENLNFTGDKSGNLTMHKWFAATACPGPYLESKFPYIAEQVNARLGATVSPTVPIVVGAIVDYTGTKHYTSANATTPKSCKPGKAKVTALSNGSKHPYHLIKESGGGSTVHGWVDAADIGGAAPAIDEPVPVTPPTPDAPKTLDGFIAHLEEEYRNHSIYVWGAQGEGKGTITEKWIRSRETSEKNANRAIAYWQAQVAAGYGNVLKAFDCSGLGMAYLQNEAEIVGNDMNANGMMSKCSKLNRQQLRRGDWVFKVYTAGDDVGRAYHIGYVVDDELNVIEAKGRDAGVVKRHVDAGGWNAYGRPSYFKAEIESQPDTGPRDLKLASPMMRGDDVEALQKKLVAIGYDLGKSGADGVYGNDTDAAVKLFQQRAAGMTAGVCDEAMRAALNL